MAKEDRYFAKQEEARPTAAGSFVRWDEQEPIEILPGLRFQPILGDNLMANLVSFEPNVVAPVHWHDEEQIAIVIDGELEFEIDGEKQMVRRGGAVVLPANVPHGARTYESSCLQIDIFNPPRQGLLELMGLIGEHGTRLDR